LLTGDLIFSMPKSQRSRFGVRPMFNPLLAEQPFIKVPWAVLYDIRLDDSGRSAGHFQAL
jgi:hypothetical protein